MRILLLISVLLVSVSAFGQNYPVAMPASPATRISQEPTAPASSIIRGRVVYDDNEMPVRRAKVMLSPVPKVAKLDEENEAKVQSSSLNYDKAAYTDMNGSFVLKNVPAGSFYPNIEHSGILSIGSMRDRPGFSLVTQTSLGDLFEIMTTDGLGEIHVQIRAKRSAAIGGVVRYPDGEPAIGQTIELFRKSQNGFEPTEYGSPLFTDERGAFRFSGLPPGDYAVRASERVAHSETTLMYGSAKSQLVTYYPSKPLKEDAEIITLGLGTDRSDIDIALPTRNLFVLRGSVISKASKEPVGVGKVSLRILEKTGEMRTRHDQEGVWFELENNGNWQFTDLPAGKYEVGYEREYESPTAKAGPRDAPSPASKKIEVSIKDADRNDVAIEVPNEAVISGTVTVEGGKPVPYMAYVSLNDEKTQNYKFVPIYDSERYSPDGKMKENTVMTFRIGDLTAGSYTFDVRSNGEYVLKSATSGGVDLLKSKLTIEEAKSISGIRLVLSTDVAKVRGVATDSSKAPLSGGFVSLVPVDVSKWETNTSFAAFYVNESGSFSGMAAPGEYYVIARKYDQAIADESSSEEKSTPRIEQMQKLIKGAQRVTLKVGENPKVSVVETVTEK